MESTIRSMTLCAGAALVGLAIAGYGLFTARGTSTQSVAPENVATVNQRPILRSDFVTQVESETGMHFDATSRAAQLKVLDEMVQEELLVQRALELDFGETDQRARTALVTAVSDQAVAEATASTPTEAELKDFYARNPERWQTDGLLTLREFVLESPASAAEAGRQAALGAAEELRAGKPAQEVMARYGLKERKHDIDEYYFVAKYRLGDALFDAVSKLPDGAVFGPEADGGGVHIVKVLANKRPVSLTFDIARPQVLMDYSDAMQMRLMNGTIKFLRGRSKIVVAIDYRKDYRP